MPQNEILSGGPPKDGIPAILEPKFFRANQAAFLEDPDHIIGVQIGKEVKAYPIKIEVNSEGEVIAVRDQKGNSIPSTFAYWFAWQAFHPSTEVFSTDR